jgi:hypothetical protein
MEAICSDALGRDLEGNGTWLWTLRRAFDAAVIMRNMISSTSMASSPSEQVTKQPGGGSSGSRDRPRPGRIVLFEGGDRVAALEVEDGATVVAPEASSPGAPSATSASHRVEDSRVVEERVKAAATAASF